MSNLQTPENITPLRAGVNGYIQSIGVSYEQSIAVAAIRFVFQEAAREPDKFNINLIRRTIDNRVDLFNQYSKNFFRGESFDHDPLMLATIGEDFLKHIKKPSNLYFPGIPGLKGKLTRILTDGAEGIWEESCDIIDNGLTRNSYPTREGLFLAHINALNDIYLMRLGFSDGDVDAVRQKMRAAYTFVKYNTDIGQALSGNLAAVEEALMEYEFRNPPAPPPPPSAPNRSHLRLV